MKLNINITVLDISSQDGYDLINAIKALRADAKIQASLSDIIVQ